MNEMTKTAISVVTTPAPMRLIDSHIGKVIPAIDIADNIGYTRSAISNIITKHPEVFKGFILKTPLQTTGGKQKLLCLNSTGIDRLIFHLRPIKNRTDLCDRIDAFRSKAFGTMVDVKTQTPTVEVNIDTELLTAKYLAEQTGGNIAAFQAIALKKCGMEDYIPALNQNQNIVHGETGWYTVTQLCAKYPMSEIEGHPERLNKFLQNNGYIYRENGIPRLQPKGEPHGMEYWYESPHGHREIRIRWRLSIMYACGLVKDEKTGLLAAR
jgi:hypothetical protein